MKARLLIKDMTMIASRKVTNMTLFVVALAGLVGLALFGLSAVVKGDDDPNTFSFDVACDCRTGARPDGNVRGAPFIIQGKIFPAGTLPAGTATNDPTLPVNEVAPIGDWICRGQFGGTLPPDIAPAYSSQPSGSNTQYYILNDGRALTAEGFDILPRGERLSVTGGIGGFRGTSGDIESLGLGTNASGCPNFRATFHIQPGSIRGNSN